MSVEAVPAIECDECGYVWTPRTDQPKYCPDCNSRLDWDNSPDVEGGYSELLDSYFAEDGEVTGIKAPRTQDGTESSLESKTETDSEEADETPEWRKD